MADAPSTDDPDRPDSVDTTEIALSPLLIVGAPRSGTTWLQRLLLAHPACVGGQESHLLVLLDRMRVEARRKLEFPRPHGPLTLVDENELLAAFRMLWIGLLSPTIRARPHARLLVEKTPDHALHLDLAAELLPACRVVHLVRHPAAVAASLIRASREPWGRDWAPGSVEAATRRWIDCVDAAEAAASHLGPERHRRIRYEDLEQDPRRTLEEVCVFAGLPTESDIIDRIVARDASGESAAIPLRGECAKTELVEPRGFGGGGDRPRLEGRALKRCLALAGSRLESLGYESSGVSR